MRKFGLIGYPLGHSFSKDYFSEKFKNENIADCIYENFPLKSILQLPELLSDEPELHGLNVTIPYKSEVIRFLDNVDPEAGEIGAVNVIKISHKQGKYSLKGYNSDITGIRDSILPYITPDQQSAIILGTGGSSRAVQYVLKKLGLKVLVVSRQKKHGILDYSDLNPALLIKTDFIINTTPLGMYPNINEKPDLNYSQLSEKHIMFDLVYNPEWTSFLKMGREQGCIVINGLKMLHSQAEKAWQIWNDNKF